MEEKFLYHIWDERHLNSDLKTVCGHPLRIVYQGQFNTGRGPDFKNAIVEINGEQMRGDVEIHIKSQDWQAHSHHEDIYYNQVILHVVLSHTAPYLHTIREDGGLIEILQMQNQLSEEISKLLEDHVNPQRPSIYCDLLSAIENDQLRLILHSAGLRRFKAKIGRFNSALSMSSFDQLFYEGLFEALGYDKNKLNTLQLAQNLPLAKLRSYKAEGMSKLELAAIYLCASGMLKHKPAGIDEAIFQQLWQLYEKQPWQGQKMHIDWQLFRIRPQNHPLKRILYLTELIWESLDTGLLSHFLIHTEASMQDPKAHYKAYTAMWQPVELFEGYPLSLGKSVRDNIYLNILLPVMALWCEKMDGTTQDVLALYSSFTGLQANYITRFMGRYMNPEQSKLVDTKAIYQQGLLDIYHRFCSWHYCSECLSQMRRIG